MVVAVAKNPFKLRLKREAEIALLNGELVKLLNSKKSLALIAVAYFVLSQTVPPGFAATAQLAVGIQAELNQPQPDSRAQKFSLEETTPAAPEIRTPSTIPILDFLAAGTLSAPSADAKTQTPTPLETPEVVSPPSVTLPPETVSIRTLTIGGTKAPGQSLWISSNGGKSFTLFVEENTETTWSASVPLVNGANDFRLVAANALLYTSAEVNVPTITYSYTMPTPTVTPPPLAVSDDPWILLSGTKAAGQSIRISSNGGRFYTQLVPKSTATTWSAWVKLAKGANYFTVLAKDAVGNSSAVVTVPPITYAMTVPAVTPPPATVVTHTVTLSGSKAPGAGIWISSDSGQSYTQLVTNDSSTTWAVLVDLGRGDNRFMVFAEDAAGNSSDLVNIPVIRCTSVTPAPGSQETMCIQGPTY